jgi:hypothetical protein
MRTFITLLIAAPLAFAQLDSNSVTVSASRSTSLQPDQAVFSLNVDTNTDVSLTDVVAAVQGAGITLSNLVGVRTAGNFNVFPPSQNPPPPQFEWTFGLPVPISKLADTATLLNTVQQNVLKNNKGWTMSFAVQGTQVSLALQQSQVCSVADLIADARIQAQKLASAAGMSVGSILAMASGTAMGTPGSGAYIGIPIGAFISTSSFASGIPPTCTATVKFALK